MTMRNDIYSLKLTTDWSRFLVRFIWTASAI